ncbi:hypothetical protein LXA43DRAFT_1010056 [Ganoderma leucocontextum]|nr:hypothetical protein LXA43DRAFT_1010056 [Ganoderma leucocontextum]
MFVNCLFPCRPSVVQLYHRSFHTLAPRPCPRSRLHPSPAPAPSTRAQAYPPAATHHSRVAASASSLAAHLVRRFSIRIVLLYNSCPSSRLSRHGHGMMHSLPCDAPAPPPRPDAHPGGCMVARGGHDRWPVRGTGWEGNLAIRAEGKEEGNPKNLKEPEGKADIGRGTDVPCGERRSRSRKRHTRRARNGRDSSPRWRRRAGFTPRQRARAPRRPRPDVSSNPSFLPFLPLTRTTFLHLLRVPTFQTSP